MNKTITVTASYTLSGKPGIYFYDLETLSFWTRLRACLYFLFTPVHIVSRHREDHVITGYFADQIMEIEDRRILEELKNYHEDNYDCNE